MNTVVAVGGMAVLAGAIAWLIVSLYFSQQREHERDELSDVERRVANQDFLRLLDGLTTIERRYQNAVRRATIGFAILGVACVAGLAINGKLLRDTHDLAVEQQQGRATAIDSLCASISAVIESGRTTITAGSAFPPEFEMNLQRLGLPPKEQRDAAAKSASAAYAQSIAKAVQDQTGVKGIVRKNGALDCVKLKRIAHADAQP